MYNSYLYVSEIKYLNPSIDIFLAVKLFNFSKLPLKIMYVFNIYVLRRITRNKTLYAK